MKSQKSPQTETWYCWKELTVVEGEDEPRLLTPWGDPSTFEYPMDWLFKTPEAAMAAKRDYAPYESWHLVKMTLEPVGFVPAEPEEED